MSTFTSNGNQTLTQTYQEGINRNGTFKVHCCDNQEDKHGLCVECEIGFISDMGEPCQRCRVGSYGRKCGDYCQCNKHEICHHIEGCLNFTYEISSTKVSTGYYTGRISTELPKKSEVSPGIFGLMKTDMVIYIICTSGLTFLLTLGLVYLNRYRRKYKRNLIEQPVLGRYVNDTEAIISNQLHDFYVYDTVDESQMIDIPNQPTIQNDESSSGLDVSDDLNISDEYLNPYQPMVPDRELHYYNKAKSVDEVSPEKSINNQG